MPSLPYFHFWCQKVLPLVFDDSLSYYEVLCKVVDYLNNITTDVNSLANGLNELKGELDIINEWIANFDTKYLEQLIEEKIATMIFVGISDAGYIVYYIPETWDDITFNTTGLDITLSDFPEYGRLVLSY